MRETAKECGLILKNQGEYVGYKKAYMYVNRKSKAVVFKDLTFWEAYELCFTTKFTKWRKE